MPSEIIQVRDVPAADARTLRARAAARNMSLSSYLRELIHDDVTRPSMAEVLDRIGTREPQGATSDEIRDSIDADHR